MESVYPSVLASPPSWLVELIGFAGCFTVAFACLYAVAHALHRPGTPK